MVSDEVERLLKEQEALKAELARLEKRLVEGEIYRMPCDLLPFFKGCPPSREWVSSVVEACVSRGYLADYLVEHEPEVKQMIMRAHMYERVREAERLDDIYREDIELLREIGIPDAEIKDVLVRRHGILEEYAQNLIDHEWDDNTIRML